MDKTRKMMSTVKLAHRLLGHRLWTLLLLSCTRHLEQTVMPALLDTAAWVSPPPKAFAEAHLLHGLLNCLLSSHRERSIADVCLPPLTVSHVGGGIDCMPDTVSFLTGNQAVRGSVGCAQASLNILAGYK